MCAVKRPSTASCFTNVFSLSRPCFSSMLISLMASRKVRFSMSFTSSCRISLNGSFCRIRSALTRTKVTISVEGGADLELEEPFLHAEHPVAHFLQGVFDLRPGECFLLAGDRFFRAALHLVHPGRPGDDVQHFELAL